MSADLAAVAPGLAAADKPVVINVAGVTAIDTAGLRWLMQLTGESRAGAGP